MACMGLRTVWAGTCQVSVCGCCVFAWHVSVLGNTAAVFTVSSSPQTPPLSAAHFTTAHVHTGVATLLADVLSALQTAARGDTGAAASGGANSLVSTISSQPSKGLLLVGRPGVGKTTLLRDIARLMSVPRSQGGLGMSVVVVDTSNEIAGA